MAKTKVETGIALIDADVNTMVSKVNEKLATLKRIEESVYKTNGEIEGFPNIKNEMKIENLLRAYSSVKVREKGYLEAAAELKKEGKLEEWPAFTINGHSTDDLKQDIILRIEIINHKETLDKLNEFKKRAEQLMTETDKKSLLAKDMEAFFGK